MERCRACGSSQVQINRCGRYAPFFLMRVPVPAVDPDYQRIVVFRSSRTEFQVLQDMTTVIICHGCGFIAPRHAFTVGELTELYRGYRGEQYNQERLAVEPGYKEYIDTGSSADEIATRNDTLTKYLERLLPADRRFDSLCDFGGSDGSFIPDLLLSRCKDVVIDEVSGVAPRDPRVRRAAGVADASLDFALSMHVLEHVGDPIGYLEGVVSKLRTGGYLYVEVPLEIDTDTLASYIAARQSYSIHEHLNRLNLGCLEKLVARCGLKVLDCSTYGYQWGKQKGQNLRALAVR